MHTEAHPPHTPHTDPHHAPAHAATHDAPRSAKYEIWVVWAAILGLVLALVLLKFFFWVMMPIYIFSLLVFICYALASAKVERPEVAPD